MKKLLLLLLPLLLFFQNSYVFAEELDNIDIIVNPKSYVLESASSSPVAQFNTTVYNALSKGKAKLGDLADIDVVDIVFEGINPRKADLLNYFSSAEELDSFVRKIATEGKNSILNKDFNDKNLIKFKGYIGKNLIGGLADRILKQKGLDDPKRRSMWIEKMLAPFNICISKCKNYNIDASICLDSLSASLTPNIGLSLAYELSKKKLSTALPQSKQSSFNIEQINTYKVCLKKAPGASNDVQTCVLNTLKSGILKITDEKLTKTINAKASNPKSASKMKQSVWPEYALCTKRVGANPKDKTDPSIQFVDCIDSLVQTTGLQLVNDKITNNEAINENFSKVEVEKMANEKVEFFKKCSTEQKVKNVREDGMLDTGKCENPITNDITYKVVVKTFSKTALDSFKSDKSIADKIGLEGKRLLDLCWNQDQTEKERDICLKKTIISFSQSIAANKLENAIPNEFSNKKELTRTSLSELANCFEKNLPSNVSSAKNLKDQTDMCSKKLTLNIAQKVARESVRSKAVEMKMDYTEVDKLVATFVDQKFAKCIEKDPSEDKISSCSGELRKNVAIPLATFKIRSNAVDKVTPADTEKLINGLINQTFSNCLGNAPSEDKLDTCIGDLTKKATQSIVLSFQKKTIKEQINADWTPLKLKPVESTFVNCTEKVYSTKVVAKSIEECTKNYALEFARSLGDLKFNNLMGSVLGTQGYNEQKKSIDDILLSYHTCLDNLKKYTMDEDLINKLSRCTDGLQNSGINLVTNTFNSWMSTEEKDAKTINVKKEFAKFIPCLGDLLPPAPFSEQVNKSNVDSILKPVALIIAQYIDYSPENASRSLHEIINKLSTDLRDISENPKSRLELIDLLYKNGALDQFLKSMVRAEVKKAFDEIPESELPDDLKKLLISKENFDKIFATPDGKLIKDMVQDKILKPLLLENVKQKSPIMDAAMSTVKERVVKMLVYAPSFGEQLTKSSIQNKINDTNGFTRFFAKAIYGKSSLNWEKVRTTSKGKEAENFIRENIVLPKFKGQKMASNLEKKNTDLAEKLVSEAIKSYE
jgi:hypothetical protein